MGTNTAVLSIWQNTLVVHTQTLLVGGWCSLMIYWKGSRVIRPVHAKVISHRAPFRVFILWSMRTAVVTHKLCNWCTLRDQDVSLIFFVINEVVLHPVSSVFLCWRAKRCGMTMKAERGDADSYQQLALTSAQPQRTILEHGFWSWNGKQDWTW